MSAGQGAEAGVSLEVCFPAPGSPLVSSWPAHQDHPRPRWTLPRRPGRRGERSKIPTFPSNKAQYLSVLSLNFII